MTLNLTRMLLASALAASAPATPALAAELVSSHFGADAEGWVDGEFTVGNATLPVTHDAGGFISTADNFGFNAFLAPGTFLGDQSAALGGTLSFDLGDDVNDGPAAAALVTLVGGDTLIFGGLIATPPATNGFTHYVVNLTAANFFTGSVGDPTHGQPISEALFASILGNLRQLSINADFHSGDDLARLDNVVLASAVPEANTWALTILGASMAGAMLRRRRPVTA